MTARSDWFAARPQGSNGPAGPARLPSASVDRARLRLRRITPRADTGAAEIQTTEIAPPTQGVALRFFAHPLVFPDPDSQGDA